MRWLHFLQSVVCRLESDKLTEGLKQSYNVLFFVMAQAAAAAWPQNANVLAFGPEEK